MTKAQKEAEIREAFDKFMALSEDDRRAILKLAGMSEDTAKDAAKAGAINIVEGQAYHSLETAAGILNTSYRTCLRYVNSGQLKATKVGGRWRVKADDLNAFMGR